MFKKLKSLFVVDDEEFRKKMGGSDVSEKSEETVPNRPQRPIPSAPINSGPPAEGKVSDKFLKILLGALEKNNLDGFDYLEFKKSLRNLEKMDMDDATRFKSAFAMAQTMNATPDNLIKTAQHYLDALASEEKKFAQAMANQRGKQIKNKEVRQQDLDKMIRNKAEQIKKLSAEIEAHQRETGKLQSEIQQAAAKVEETRADFVASYKTIISQIEGDVEKMKQFLK